MNWMFFSNEGLRLRKYPLRAYSVAILFVGAAVLATTAVVPLHSTPSVLFFAAVASVAWLGGKGPALLATVLSTLALDFFFVYPFSPCYRTWRT